MTTTLILGLLTALFLLATALSFARIPHGIVRGLAFPRIQILVLAALLAALTIWLVPDSVWRWTLLAGQAIVVLVQGISIAQFLPVRAKQSQAYRGDPDGPNTVSILSCNVKMSNRHYGKAVELTRRIDPDIAVFMETDQAWVDALQPVGEVRPNIVSHPLDDAYGIVLFSRLELAETSVQYLVMDEVPSIITIVTLPDGQRFRLYVVHPEPPVPYEDSLGRDAELLKVAGMVEKDPMPAIVCGDLNDVAWSHTTRMFQRISRLLDPRVGRGFYNTFDARYPFLRWPLDHLFHHERFQLIDMGRMPTIDSDHFPMYFKLALTEQAEEAQAPHEENAADREEAEEIAEGAKDLDREAIGVDWEK